MSKFKYLWCILDESGTDNPKCHRKVASGRQAAGMLEYARVLHERFLMSVLLYGSETMVWREKERSRN